MELDEQDKRIIRELQRDGRIQNNELAKRVGLSPSPCLRRVKLLEEAGIISRYVAVIDQTKVGLRLSMFARVWLTAQDSETIDLFIAAMRQLPEVVECYAMSGDMDYLLRIQVADLAHFSKFAMDTLMRHPAVVDMRSFFALQQIKETTELRL